MGITAGSAYSTGFTTQRADTCVVTDLDASPAPAATATVNGFDDSGFSLTITKIDTGRYKVTGIVPSDYAAGDIVVVSVSGSVNSIAGKAIIDQFVIESTPVYAGSGSVSVDHNYGGTDDLRFVTSGGLGVDGAIIRAYLKTDWDADLRSDTYIKGRAETDVNGRWLAPMYLDPASYTLAYSVPGNSNTTTEEVTVS